MKKPLGRFGLLFFVFIFIATSPANAGNIEKVSGLKYEDIEVGAGDMVEVGNIAVIHFSGWIDENGRRGKEIYRSRKENKPISFVVGAENVISAWNEGIIGMQPGGTRMLLVPPHLGFGAKAVEDVIPPNAHMRFVVELLEVK